MSVHHDRLKGAPLPSPARAEGGTQSDGEEEVHDRRERLRASGGGFGRAVGGGPASLSDDEDDFAYAVMKPMVLEGRRHEVTGRGMRAGGGKGAAERAAQLFEAAQQRRRLSEGGHGDDDDEQEGGDGEGGWDEPQRGASWWRRREKLREHILRSDENSEAAAHERRRQDLLRKMVNGVGGGGAAGEDSGGLGSPMNGSFTKPRTPKQRVEAALGFAPRRRRVTHDTVFGQSPCAALELGRGTLDDDARAVFEGAAPAESPAMPETWARPLNLGAGAVASGARRGGLMTTLGDEQERRAALGPNRQRSPR